MVLGKGLGGAGGVASTVVGSDPVGPYGKGGVGLVHVPHPLAHHRQWPGNAGGAGDPAAAGGRQVAGTTEDWLKLGADVGQQQPLYREGGGQTGAGGSCAGLVQRDVHGRPLSRKGGNDGGDWKCNCGTTNVAAATFCTHCGKADFVDKA